MSYDSIDLNFRRFRVPYFKLIDKSKEKKKLKKKLDQFNKYLKSYGLKFSNIDVTNTNTNVTEETDYSFNIESNNETKVEVSKAAICQTAKDVALMSDKSYTKFRNALSPFAKLCTLGECNTYKLRVNQFWRIQTNEMGSYLKDPISKIKFVCQKYLEKLSKLQPPEEVKDKTFKILLSGDGVNLTRTQLNVLNFTFSLVNDGDLSLCGFYTLGIFKIQKENYENIKTSLKELLSKLEKINEIVINNTTYRISFLAGGDLKWLSEVFGINAGNSHYPCPWCKWKMKKEMKEADLNETYSIHDRSHAEAQLCLKNKSKNIDARHGYVAPSIFSFIEFNKMVVDVLHLTLRITDKLFDMLLCRLDKLEKPSKSDDLTKLLKNFIEIECHISFSFSEDTDKKINLSKLNQNERFKIIDKFYADSNTLMSIFPEELRMDATLTQLNKLFFDFRKILQIIKRDNRHNFDSNSLKSKLKEWLSDFIKIEPKITPYIHIFCFHIPEFIEIHGDLSLFSMQGLEKSNGFSKVNFFRQTNRHKNTFTTTLLKKMNRFNFIHLNGNLNEDKKEHIPDDEKEHDEYYKDKYPDMFDFLLDNIKNK